MDARPNLRPRRRARLVALATKLVTTLATSLAFALVIGTAAAQATWTVESLIPDVISIRVPTTEIAFAIPAADYPPETFPAQYPATTPEGGVLPVQVFSNAEGVWSLVLEIPEMRTLDGGDVIPADRVLVRVNGGVWLRGDGNPQVVHTQSGPTVGWEELRLEFALELQGDEPAGAYAVNLLVTAIREPGL